MGNGGDDTCILGCLVYIIIIALLATWVFTAARPYLRNEAGAN